MKQCAIEDVTTINYFSGGFVGYQEWKLSIHT
jgi:hypothetical protein